MLRVWKTQRPCIMRMMHAHLFVQHAYVAHMTLLTFLLTCGVTDCPGASYLTGIIMYMADVLHTYKSNASAQCCCRVALVLERNNAVELKPSMEDLFEAVRKVCEDVMAITEDLPRLAMLGTARQLKELEVILSGPAAASSVLLELL